MKKNEDPVKQVAKDVLENLEAKKNAKVEEPIIDADNLEVDEEKINLINENKALNDKVLRLSAEIQNMKRRYEDQIHNISKYDGQEIITSLLVILDNFERAISMDDTNLTDDVSKFLSGFKMTYANMKSIFESYGIKEIECLNQDFDHNFMQAVLTEKVDGVEPGKVIDVMQKGYIYNDKVIRYAMVKVSE